MVVCVGFRLEPAKTIDRFANGGSVIVIDGHNLCLWLGSENVRTPAFVALLGRWRRWCTSEVTAANNAESATTKNFNVPIVISARFVVKQQLIGNSHGFIYSLVNRFLLAVSSPVMDH